MGVSNYCPIAIRYWLVTSEGLGFRLDQGDVKVVAHVRGSEVGSNRCLQIVLTCAIVIKGLPEREGKCFITILY